MKKIDVEAEKRCAIKALQTLRKGTLGYADCLEALHFSLHFAGLTLVDIGTSETELERCRVLGCKTGAQAWLSVLRKGTDRPGEFLVSLEEDLHFGGLSYADIKTTATEVASFGRPLRSLLDPALALYFV